ncbi:MAG: hypothetical protein AAB367_02675 [Patescibacteria group bacterium]
MKHPKRWIGIIAILIVVWFLRPLFHPFVMIFVVSPLRAVLIAAFLYAVWWLVVRSGLRVEQRGENNYVLKAPPGRGKMIGLYVAVLIGLAVLVLVEQEIRYKITAGNIEYEKRTDVPQFEPIRLTPKAVAQRYAEDTFQNPQEHLGDSQIVLVDGVLKRVMPRLPDGVFLYFLNKLSGFVTVDVDTLDRKVGIENAEFKYSEGIGLVDNLYYQLSLKRYFVTYSDEPTYLKTPDNQWVAAVPYMGYKGFVFRMPYWAGVMVVHQDGTIEDFSPEAAAEVPYLKGNRIHPKEIVNFYAHAYAYRGGLLNKWFLHKNQTEVVSLPGNENIFHVPTHEGFKQLVVAEPYGRSYGIYKIFIFDATTGEREIIEYDETSQLTGPVAAADYIKKEFPTYDWNVFNLSEPRPIKVGGDLHWLLSIVPRDNAGIASTVLLNTRTNAVINTKTEGDLKAFLQNGTPPAGEAEGGDANTNIRRKIEDIERALGELKGLLK